MASEQPSANVQLPLTTEQIMAFGAGKTCYGATPQCYKVIAENSSGKLVHMKLKPGGIDNPHDHPTHYLYVVKGGKLKLSPPPGQTEGSAEVEMPDGAAMVIPAGPHQVSNVGDNEVEILFVEPTSTANPWALDGDYTSPVSVCPQCYKVLAEDDDWFVGEMTMKAGEEDPPHSHMDHLLYVLEGNGVTIQDLDAAGNKVGGQKAVPIKPGFAAPIPSSHHIVKNSGSEPCKIIFFELKKK